jgi:hypothetical protein
MLKINQGKTSLPPQLTQGKSKIARDFPLTLAQKIDSKQNR